jgi:uncharacterized protein
MLDILILALIGMIGGLASGLFGVGGGLIFVPLLMLLKKFDIHMAIGTSLLIIVPTAIVACLKHWNAGMVEWKAAPLIAVFAILGSFAGATLSVNMETVILKRVFAVFLVLVAAKIFFTK